MWIAKVDLRKQGRKFPLAREFPQFAPIEPRRASIIGHRYYPTPGAL
jgi:hypothetical protein